jgi:NAD(P)-dependent dehydrogenase (short-subunit alcohol dehydrogenase family)
MNVVIIGGGQKFGKIIADKFRDEGNNVYILSHKDYGNNPNHLYANFFDIHDVVNKFKKLIENIDKIDLFLYNSNADYGPCSEEDYCTGADITRITNSWIATLSIQAIIPHIIATIALTKMEKNSKIVFMTSGLAFAVPRNFATSSVGHPGGKAAQTHLMFALAKHNDKGVIVYSISTHFEYDNSEKLSKTISRIYENLNTFNSNISGRIIKFWQ